MRTRDLAGCWALVLVALLSVRCSSGSSGQPYAGYSPPFLPVKFVIKPSGVVVQGEASLVTPLGEFSVGAEYELRRSSDSILVRIRDRKRGKNGIDTIYRVRSGGDQFVAVMDGRTSIEIVDRQVQIDVTEGDIESIEFKRATRPIAEQNGIPGMWNSFWDRAPFRYHPLALARWAYDDSTIGKWWGLGFVWFVVRLVLAILLLIPDIILTAAFGLGTFLYVLLGITVRNVYYGLVFLLVVISLLETR